MAPTTTTIASPIRQAWHRWKALRLPWRKRFLIGASPHPHLPSPPLTPPGLDLHGNTFWEFRDTLGAGQRMRRIVHPRLLTPASDVKVSPQWHQWLRHTRADPPSLDEQTADVRRRREMSVLAAQADARWAAKRQVGAPPEGESAPRGAEAGGGEQREDPWKRARRNPGEEWQPEAWGGGPAGAKRQ
jgi:NADH dehydrogenase [ubiquinone] 1 alpha subcomplex assembly factor 2